MGDTPWVARLYPERGSSLYVRVQVWPTRGAMLAYLKAYRTPVDGRSFSRRTQGTCGGIHATAYRTGRRPRVSPCFAEVNLWRGCLGIGVITHELFHATMRWAWRVGFDLGALKSIDCSALEERITYAHGTLCAQLMTKGLRPGGIYTDRDTAAGRR